MRIIQSQGFNDLNPIHTGFTFSRPGMTSRERKRDEEECLQEYVMSFRAILHLVNAFLKRPKIRRAAADSIWSTAFSGTITDDVRVWRRRWDSNPRRLFTSHDFQSCSLGHYETPPAQRREWDSNPRGLFTLPLFESGTFDHSDISPLRSIAYLPNQGKL